LPRTGPRGEGVPILKQRFSLAAWRVRLLQLPRFAKRTILAVADFLILSFALWVAISLRYSEFWVPRNAIAAVLFISGPLFTVGIFAAARLYKFVTRYLGYLGHSRIVAAIWLSVLIWSLLVFMLGQYGIPRSAILGYGLLATLLISASRALVAMFLETSGIHVADLPRGDAERKAVLIYGAGDLGVQLLGALRRSVEYEPFGFIDPEPSLWRQFVGGLKVYPPTRLADLIDDYDVHEVVIALPEGRRRERRRIYNEIQALPVKVKILPALEDITSGRARVSDLRPLEVNDLLGRDKVPPHRDLLSRSTTDKSILVTGAGGTVGSEIASQLAQLAPSKIVLFDISEAALYEIDERMREIVASLLPGQRRPEIVTVLGSVLDRVQMRETMASNEIDVVYHAAAYKHVPIVEQNPICGLLNNTFGAAVVAECAKAAGVELVVLVSTDKAVRPTNVMGASKRLAEMVLQAEAADGSETIFTMVRFGNVLDSSGSVVRKFRRQIRSGGPVTVTHPDVFRYFMSISEAAELVVQAGAMAQGGEVFVLDMGEPVRIADLASLMVKLTGLEVRSPERPEGEIEIVYTGLRPGEKLCEELLIGAHTMQTEHPRIQRSDEPFLSSVELKRELERLKAAMDVRDVETMHAVLMQTVEGYHAEPRVTPGEEAQAGAWRPSSRTLH